MEQNPSSPSKEPFTKHPGSNPKQIRRQFLQHTMLKHSQHSSSSTPPPTGKLKPAREILNRLKFDARYDTKEYVVGCIDRQAGIVERPVEAWGGHDEEELVAYIKKVSGGEIVWDRARKVDLVSGAKDR